MMQSRAYVQLFTPSVLLRSRTVSENASKRCARLGPGPIDAHKNGRGFAAGTSSDSRATPSRRLGLQRGGRIQTALPRIFQQRCVG